MVAGIHLMLRALALSCIFSLWLAFVVSAQEWPRFRGPNGAGVSATTFPTTWTEKDYRWQVKLPGPGHSSPVLWGDRLYVTGSDTAGKLYVLCLDAASGRTLWNRAFAAAGPPRG